MSADPEEASFPGEPERRLLEIVSRFLAEQRPAQESLPAVTLDSLLDKDLAIDSLGRVELFTRIERAFGVSISEQVLAHAETPRDILRAIDAATPTAATPAVRARAPGLEAERMASTPQAAQTLCEVLDNHVRMHGERTHLSLLSEDGVTNLSYNTLREEAGRIAGALRAQGIAPGDAVALMLPTGRDYFLCFLGVLLAGAVPVPIYPPARLSQIEEHLRRHAGILNNALTKMLITVPEAAAVARFLKSQVSTLTVINTPAELQRHQHSMQAYHARPDDVALLQYTSGSTGNPKGVILTHAHLLANIRAMGRAAQATSADVFISWLPLYHDMGLIGAWLGSLYYACHYVVMSPLSFLARPERWLWAIHNYRGTLSAAPNFAYELCLSKIPDDALHGLDLSSLRMAFNGAEPVSADTIQNFSRRFAPYGFRAEAMAPVYGLAECAVGLAFPPPGRGPLIDHISRATFSRSGQAEPVEADNADAQRVVCCGRPLPGYEVRVVDATGMELGERSEGRLEFRGPSATSGYMRNPEQTRLLFHDDWLDSGDYAYVAEGEIYMTGRAKDVIIRGGRNIYPYELEEAVGNLSGIRKGCVAVFGAPDPVAGTERLVIMAETRETAREVRESLRKQIQTTAVDVVGTPADEISLVPVHTVLKTSSGKIRRSACREIYVRGIKPQRAVWWQMSRLAWVGFMPQWRRGLRTLSGAVYAGYAWAMFWVLAPLTWLAVSLLPRPSWSWTVSRAIARLFARLAFTPVTVRGLERLPRDKPCVLVANHASYIDGIVLVAVLNARLSPTGYYSFIAKRELVRDFVAGTYLRHLGAEFVERFDVQRGVEDVQQVARTLRAGCPLIFFPEGTFDRAAGLLPFRMGAFAVAAEAGVPVVPVSLRGTRSILRSGQWYPRHGAISVVFSEPLYPEGTDWNAALQLRDTARREILRGCGEPDMGG